MANDVIFESLQVAAPSEVAVVSNGTLIGNRIPRDYFVTTGIGESDITVHAGSYHLALREAGIEMCNIMTYSSILPSIATEITKPDLLIHGSVMETIMAVANSVKGQRATAGIIWGWLKRKDNGQKHGGLVCEYNGDLPEQEAREQLRASLNELYTNGYDDDFDLEEGNLISKSFVPEKKYGTVLVSLCFTNYVIPILQA